MKKFTILGLTALSLFMAQTNGFAQAPNLGSAGNFVIFSAQGNVSNIGNSYITGNVGTNGGSSTGFGNVNGVMADGTPMAVQAAIDVQSAYNQMDAATPTSTPTATLGNGLTLNPGVHSISSSATLSQNLILDGLGDPNAVFIFQIDGSLISSTNASIITTNGAKACNTFWKVEGFIALAPGTSMKGTMIANNADVSLTAGDTLQGRAFTTGGNINIDQTTAYTPLGCGTPTLDGPIAPNLATSKCFALFSSNGTVSNSGVTNVTGDVGGNSGATTGFDSSLVNGVLHYMPNPTTASCATDLANVYGYLNGLNFDIELLYPSQFGAGLMLTPHAYLLNGSTILTDTLVLNAMGNGNAIFVIRIIGDFTAMPNSYVKLINGTLSSNVYWQIEGALNLNNNSTLRGTMICNNSVVSTISAGVMLDGRIMTTNGALATTNFTAIAPNIPLNCVGTVGVEENEEGNSIQIYPNPSVGSFTIELNDNAKLNNVEISLYNAIGMKVMTSTIVKNLTRIDTSKLPAGMYFYSLIENNKSIQSGKIIAQ